MYCVSISVFACLCLCMCLLCMCLFVRVFVCVCYVCICVFACVCEFLCVCEFTYKFFKNLYLPQFLTYNNVKDSFGKIILSTFIWLQFHRRLSPISAVKPV